MLTSILKLPTCKITSSHSFLPPKSQQIPNKVALKTQGRGLNQIRGCTSELGEKNVKLNLIYNKTSLQAKISRMKHLYFRGGSMS